MKRLAIRMKIRLQCSDVLWCNSHRRTGEIGHRDPLHTDQTCAAWVVELLRF